jgi:hypothetical protein
MGNKVAREDIYNDIRNNIFISESELYKLISNKGDGYLVELARDALKQNDFTMLDDFLRNEMIKFLYNNGEGKNVINNYICINF